MGIVSFLKSKVFLKQLVLAFSIVIILCFIIVYSLDFRTNHGEEITVPDLSKMSVNQAEAILEELDLEYHINDTLNFNGDFPPNSIVEQDPVANTTVKSGRKIYVKLNSAQYELVEIPEVKDQTFRQILPKLKALGFEEGKVEYKPYFAEDVVLELKHNNKVLKPGDKIPRASKIDFVLGDGKTVFIEDQSLLETENTLE